MYIYICVCVCVCVRETDIIFFKENYSHMNRLIDIFYKSILSYFASNITVFLNFVVLLLNTQFFSRHNFSIKCQREREGRRRERGGVGEKGEEEREGESYRGRRGGGGGGEREKKKYIDIKKTIRNS